MPHRDRRRSFASTSDISSGTLPSVTSIDNELPYWAEDLECAICSKLLYEPVTTSCGHTFCRLCLIRALDTKDTCALCRTVIHMDMTRPLPITRVLHATIARLLPTAYAARAAETTHNSLHNGGRIPLFPLSMVVFPRHTHVLHIFEPRYRLMLRRVLSSGKKFGLLNCTSDIGCVVEIFKVVPIPDGRSLIETVARSRFRVRSRDEVDGYLVGTIEPYKDDRPNNNNNNNNIQDLVTHTRTIIDSLLSSHASQQAPLSEALEKLREVPPIEAGPDALGLWLAGLLVTELPERQRLLELRDSTARLTEMTQLLEKYVDKLIRDGNTAGIESRYNRECVIS